MGVVRIQDLTAAPLALTGTEVLEIEQGGESHRTTAQAIADLAAASGAVPVQEEGSTVVAAPTAINFVGAGVTVTDVGGVATATIPGGGGGSLRDGVTALSISSGVVNIDCALGDFFTLALTANVTSITFTNLPASGKAVSLAIRATQDGTGGRTVALPAAFKATTGSDTAVQSAANARTLITLTTFDQGTRWEYTMRGVAA